MEIGRSLWPALAAYLFNDRKLSENAGSKSALFSRFNTLCKAFPSGTPFNRQNFVMFIGQMREKKYKPSHINNMIKMAKHLDRFLELNQLQDFTYFTENRSKPSHDILSHEEIKKLADIDIPYTKFCEYINLRQKALIMLMGTTGCRIGEAINLRWVDLKTEPHHVIFEGENQTGTKNGDKRAVCIAPQIFDLIIQLPRKSQYIFASSRGERVASQQINLDLKRRMKAIGIEKPIWNHLFRHSYITTMRQRGMDWIDIAKIVGHKDPKSTMRYDNTDLWYQSNLIFLNPLLQHNMTLEQIGEKMLTMAIKFINRENFKTRLSDHEPNSVCLMFKKND